MQEIDGMDMLGYLRVRAWDARREQRRRNAPARKAYIDEVWPAE